LLLVTFNHAIDGVISVRPGKIGKASSMASLNSPLISENADIVVFRRVNPSSDT